MYKADKMALLMREMLKTYRDKNADYGDSFAKSYKEFGLVAPVVRMSDKMERIKALSKADAKVKDESIKDTLLDLANYAIMTVVEFAETPLEEREEPKKYYFKHRWAKTKNGNWMYLALRQRPSISYLTLQGSDEDVFEYQVRFTRKEIDEIKNKYNTDLKDFEIVEVEE